MSAVIFNGTKVKTLKSILSLNGNSELQSGTVNVQSVATDAPAGSIYMRTDTGDVYRKLDSGSSTNWVLIGSGGSSGGLNFVGLDSSFKLTSQSDIDAEVTVGNHVAYADAPGVEPVDMTGGSPVTTVTRSASGPLNGAASILMDLGSGSSRQGEGHSLLINVPTGYRGLRLEYSFAFAVTGAVVEDDLRLAVYDVTNSQLITDLVQVNKVLSSSGIARVQFSLPASCAQARVGLHIARVSTGALSVKMDDFNVSPKLSTIGVAGSDTLPVSLSYDALGLVTAEAVSTWRAGDHQHYMGTVTAGTVDGSDIAINLPAGLLIDAAKMNGSAQKRVGTASRLQSASTNMPTPSSGPWDIFYDGSTTGKLYLATNTTGVLYTKGTGSGTLSNADILVFKFDVPIAGFSSNVTLASDPTASPIEATYQTAAGQTLTAAAPIDFGTMVTDSNGAVTTGASWNFKAPADGNYKVSWALLAVGLTDYASLGFNTQLRKNGSGVFKGTSSNTGVPNQMWSVSTVDIFLKKGDLIDIYNIDAHAAGSLNTDAQQNYISVSRITGSTSLAIEGPRQELALSVSGSPPGFGSAGTATFRFDTVLYSTGSSLSHVDSATNGGRVVISANGVYSVQISTNNVNGSNREIAAILNSTDLTSAQGGTLSEVISLQVIVGGGSFGAASGVRLMRAGDFITFQADPAVGTGSSTYTLLRVTKVAD